MIKRTLAALALLTSSAWAQTEPAASPPAEATPVSAAPADAAAPPLAADVAMPAPVALPTDPIELVTLALAHAREAQQCRFAFSRLQTTAAQVTWSNADAESELRFDPRLPIGERWTVVRASRQQRAIQRALSRQDRKGLPFDLITITAEGEWTFENIAYASELPDRYVYNFTPRMIPERTADEAGAGIIEQLVGQMEVSRETGRILASTLREPPPGTAVRAMGIVRVHRALLHNFYATDAGGRQLTDSGSQMFQMSALLSQTEVTTSFRFTDVEPICDPAVIAQITAAEAAAQAADRD